ncbi:hypothetical protein AOLI_G00257990 [Acnodon oligacanthus]
MDALKHVSLTPYRPLSRGSSSRGKVGRVHVQFPHKAFRGILYASWSGRTSFAIPIGSSDTKRFSVQFRKGPRFGLRPALSI